MVLSTYHITFAARRVGGTSSGVHTIIALNAGSRAIVLGRVAVEGADFALAPPDTCSNVTLPPHQNCTIGVIFKPLGVGPRTGRVRILSTAANSPRFVTLTGVGLAPPTPTPLPTATPRPTATLTPRPTATTPPPMLAPSIDHLTFSPRRIGTTSRVHQLILVVVGSRSLTVGRISVEGQSYSLVQPDACSGMTLQPRGQCIIGVIFRPVAVGPRHGRLRIPSTAANGLLYVSLNGAGLPAPAPTPIPPPPASAARIKLSDYSLRFGTHNVGTPSAPQPVTIVNVGTAPLALGRITVGGESQGDFAVAQPDTCSGNTLTPHSTCSIGVIFTPSMPGQRRATLRIPGTAANSPQLVALDGAGRS